VNYGPVCTINLAYYLSCWQTCASCRKSTPFLYCLYVFLYLVYIPNAILISVNQVVPQLDNGPGEGVRSVFKSA